MPRHVCPMTEDNGNSSARTASSRDVPALQLLWQTVFGDSAEDVGHFFDVYYSPELTAVIGEPGAPAAAAYAVPVGELVLPDRRRLPCAMIYAVAANPELRGRGYGAAVSRAAGRFAVDAGYPAAVLKPASAGLFDFYEKHTDFRAYFNVYDIELPRERLTAAQALTPKPVSPREYRRLRNRFLSGSAYIDDDERALEYQQYLCRSAGGGLYALSDGGDCVACAIAEKDGGLVTLKELLSAGSGSLVSAASALASLKEAERCHVRSPMPMPEAQAAPVPFGMMLTTAGPECLSAHSATWYGAAFD